jgi:hypothetical protein
VGDRGAHGKRSGVIDAAYHLDVLQAGDAAEVSPARADQCPLAELRADRADHGEHAGRDENGVELSELGRLTRRGGGHRQRGQFVRGIKHGLVLVDVSCWRPAGFIREGSQKAFEVFTDVVSGEHFGEVL